MKPRRTRFSAYALLHDSGRILLSRMSAELPEWQGQWTLPGGGLEFGEAPAEAMVREVKEETGLDVVPCSVALVDSITDFTRDHEDFQGIRILYYAEVTGGTLRAEAVGTTDDCAWFPLHEEVAGAVMTPLAQVGLKVARERWMSE